MKLIAFIGMAASGKSEAVEIARNLGIPVVTMGDVVREEVKRLGLPETDENNGIVGAKLREEEGMDAIAKRCVPKIKKTNSDIVVVDGVRGIAEVNLFRKEFGDDFTLIEIFAPTEIRIDRVKNRARSDDISDLEALKKRDKRELEWGMGKAIKIADITIENAKSLEEFKNEVQIVLKRLLPFVQ
ncbi:MAG: dephospho-CoA kinase [Methanosarcinales archaeon]